MGETNAFQSYKLTVVTEALIFIYNACILSLMLHAASVWLPSEEYAHNIKTAGKAFNSQKSFVPVRIQAKLVARQAALRTFTRPCGDSVINRQDPQEGRKEGFSYKRH